MNKTIFTLIIIISGLGFGYLFKTLTIKKLIRFPGDLQKVGKFLQVFTLFVLNPIVFVGAIWTINLKNIRFYALPFIGLFALVLGGYLAYVFAKWLSMSNQQTGSFIVSGGMTNIAIIGGLVCFTFLGEAGFALVSFYNLFETFSYYAIGFPIAKMYSSGKFTSTSKKDNLKRILLDPFVLIAIICVVFGLCLNISGIKRPGFYSNLNAILIPTATVCFCISIGLGLRVGHIGQNFKKGMLIALIKFLIVPFSVTTVALLLGFGKIDNGLPLKVVIILSSMPVAFTAVIPPSLYNLDIDLANTNWIITNTALLLVIPLLQVILSMF